MTREQYQESRHRALIETIDRLTSGNKVLTPADYKHHVKYIAKLRKNLEIIESGRFWADGQAEYYYQALYSDKPFGYQVAVI